MKIIFYIDVLQHINITRLKIINQPISTKPNISQINLDNKLKVTSM